VCFYVLIHQKASENKHKARSTLRCTKVAPNALIFYQILSTYSSRKCIQISQENLYMDIAKLEELRNNHSLARSQFSQGLNCIIAKKIMMMMMMMMMMTKMAMMIPKFCLWLKKIKIVPVLVFWNDLNFAATTVTSSTNLIPVVLL